jgi:MFS family permease
VAVAVERDDRVLVPIAALAARYAAFLRQPDVARILALTFVARMPVGTLTLSMLLHVRAITGSFAVAGGVVGAYLTASALSAPFVGRWVDRRGAVAPLALTGALYPLSIGVLLVADSLGLSFAAMHVAAASAGVFAPPIVGITRTMLRQRFTDEHVRRTAFALDAVLVEMVFTVGPLLVAAMLAFASPRAALAMAWCFALASVPAFALSRALRYLRTNRDTERSLLGPIADRRLLGIYALTIVIAVGFGAFEVGYPGFGVALGATSIGGVLIAVNSVGSALGGLAYGGLHVGLSPQRIAPRLLAAMVVPLALHAVTLNLAILCVLAFLTGALIAPALTSVMLMISTHAPARYATEAFTWSSTCILGGLGIGTIVAGHIVDTHGPQATMLFGACTMALAAIVAAIVARHLPENITP